MESRIRILCALLLAAQDCDTAQTVAAELQAAIHDHIEAIRDKLILLPVETDTPIDPAA